MENNYFSKSNIKSDYFPFNTQYSSEVTSTSIRLININHILVLLLMSYSVWALSAAVAWEATFRNAMSNKGIISCWLSLGNYAKLS